MLTKIVKSQFSLNVMVRQVQCTRGSCRKGPVIEKACPQILWLLYRLPLNLDWFWDCACYQNMEKVMPHPSCKEVATSSLGMPALVEASRQVMGPLSWDRHAVRKPRLASGEPVGRGRSMSSVYPAIPARCQHLSEEAISDTSAPACIT